MKMEVYYWKNIDWLTKSSYVGEVTGCRYPTKTEFKKDYKKIPITFPFNDKLGDEVNFGRVYSRLNQGNNPLATLEMQRWIRSNLNPHPHTSMSIGDVIKVGDKYWITINIGWDKLNW